MKKYFVFAAFALFICCFFSDAHTLAAQAETTDERISGAKAEAQNQELLRSNLQLQEQLHTALRAIEQARQDAEAASKKTEQLFTERLNAVEKNLALQREHDLQTVLTMRQSNRLALVAAAILAGVGILALFLTAFFQIRALNKITEVSAHLSSNHDFLSNDHFNPSRALGETNGNHPAQLERSGQVTSRFQSAVEQLERRIQELELNSSFNQIGKSPESEVPANGSKRSLTDSNAHRSLLSEGQSFLNNNEAEKALICFEKVLEAEPDSAEAWVKKGTALEALRKLPEAIETYDRAIASDNSLTVAYLYKGGVLNRLQRFSEAMECYEQALRTHPKKLV